MFLPTWLRSLYFFFAFVVFVVGGGFIFQHPTLRIRSGPALVGQITPSIRLLDRQGGLLTERALRGQWILLNFWATWCEPCRKEMPSLVRLSQKLPKARLIAASVDTTWELIDTFVAGHPLLRRSLGRMQIYWDQAQQNTLRFGTRKFPETYLIHPSGQIRYKFIGPYEWDDPKLIGQIDALMRQP